MEINLRCFSVLSQYEIQFVEREMRESIGTNSLDIRLFNRFCVIEDMFIGMFLLFKILFDLF